MKQTGLELVGVDKVTTEKYRKAVLTNNDSTLSIPCKKSFHKQVRVRAAMENRTITGMCLRAITLYLATDVEEEEM